MTDIHIQDATAGETWRCPTCGNTTSFRIEANLPVDLTVKDNGQIVLEVDASDADWTRDTFCLCLNETCGASGEVKDFTPEEPQPVDEDEDEDEDEGEVVITHYPGQIFLDAETGQITGNAPSGWRGQLTRTELDRANLDAALALIRKHCPGVVAVHLETSDQRTSGFVFSSFEYEFSDSNKSLHLWSGEPITDLPDEIGQEVSDLLSELAWDGVVGESREGYARIPLPTASTPEGPTS
jgi:hypothetical protein